MGYRSNHHQYQLFSELEDGSNIYKIQMGKSGKHASALIEYSGDTAIVSFGKITRTGVTMVQECHVRGASSKSDTEILDEAIVEVLMGKAK